MTTEVTSADPSDARAPFNASKTSALFAYAKVALQASTGEIGGGGTQPRTSGIDAISPPSMLTLADISRRRGARPESSTASRKSHTNTHDYHSPSHRSSSPSAQSTLTECPLGHQCPLFNKSISDVSVLCHACTRRSSRPTPPITRPPSIRVPPALSDNHSESYDSPTSTLPIQLPRQSSFSARLHPSTPAHPPHLDASFARARPSPDSSSSAAAAMAAAYAVGGSPPSPSSSVTTAYSPSAAAVMTASTGVQAAPRTHPHGHRGAIPSTPLGLSLDASTRLPSSTIPISTPASPLPQSAAPHATPWAPVPPPPSVAVAPGASLGVPHSFAPPPSNPTSSAAPHVSRAVAHQGSTPHPLGPPPPLGPIGPAHLNGSFSSTAADTPLAAAPRPHSNTTPQRSVLTPHGADTPPSRPVSGVTHGTRSSSGTRTIVPQLSPPSLRSGSDEFDVPSIPPPRGSSVSTTTVPATAPRLSPSGGSSFASAGGPLGSTGVTPTATPVAVLNSPTITGPVATPAGNRTRAGSAARTGGGTTLHVASAVGVAPLPLATNDQRIAHQTAPTSSPARPPLGPSTRPQSANGAMATSALVIVPPNIATRVRPSSAPSPAGHVHAQSVQKSPRPATATVRPLRSVPMPGTFAMLPRPSPPASQTFHTPPTSPNTPTGDAPGVLDSRTAPFANVAVHRAADSVPPSLPLSGSLLRAQRKAAIYPQPPPPDVPHDQPTAYNATPSRSQSRARTRPSLRSDDSSARDTPADHLSPTRGARTAPLLGPSGDTAVDGTQTARLSAAVAAAAPAAPSAPTAGRLPARAPLPPSAPPPPCRPAIADVTTPDAGLMLRPRPSDGAGGVPLDELGSFSDVDDFDVPLPRMSRASGPTPLGAVSARDVLSRKSATAEPSVPFGSPMFADAQPVTIGRAASPSELPDRGRSGSANKVGRRISNVARIDASCKPMRPVTRVPAMVAFASLLNGESLTARASDSDDESSAKDDESADSDDDSDDDSEDATGSDSDSDDDDDDDDDDDTSSSSLSPVKTRQPFRLILAVPAASATLTSNARRATSRTSVDFPTPTNARSVPTSRRRVDPSPSRSSTSSPAASPARRHHRHDDLVLDDCLDSD